MYSLRGLPCILIALLLVNVLSAKQCFNLECNAIVDGDPSIQRRQPCNPSAQVSTCCSHGDLCLSNWLCLDNGGNGRFTAQGCTDPGWPAPCRAEFRGCPSSITPDYVPLWMCQSLGHTIDFCCDSADARCCVAALAGNQTMFSLPLWGDVWRPGNGRHGGSSGSGGSGTLGLADRLMIALSIIFGLLGAVIILLQLRYMARESEERGESARLRVLLRRQFRLWFPAGAITARPAPLSIMRRQRWRVLQRMKLSRLR